MRNSLHDGQKNVLMQDGPAGPHMGPIQFRNYVISLIICHQVSNFIEEFQLGQCLILFPSLIRFSQPPSFLCYLYEHCKRLRSHRELIDKQNWVLSLLRCILIDCLCGDDMIVSVDTCFGTSTQALTLGSNGMRAKRSFSIDWCDTISTIVLPYFQTGHKPMACIMYQSNI